MDTPAWTSLPRISTAPNIITEVRPATSKLMFPEVLQPCTFEAFACRKNPLATTREVGRRTQLSRLQATDQGNRPAVPFSFFDRCSYSVSMGRRPARIVTATCTVLRIRVIEILSTDRKRSATFRCTNPRTTHTTIDMGWCDTATAEATFECLRVVLFSRVERWLQILQRYIAA